MWKNKKQPVDERIEKESNRMSAKMYYLMSVLAIVSIVVKVCYKLPVYVYALELISLAVSGIFCVVSELKYGMMFIKNKDEELLSIHYKVLSRAMRIGFWIIIIGEILFMFIAKGYWGWGVLYIAIWGIPFYLMFVGFMKLAEKRADKNVDKKEREDEE